MFLAVRLYCSFVMEYDIHTILDIATLATTLWVIYMIHFKLRATYMEAKDNLSIYYVVIPCAVLSVFVYPTTSHHILNRIAWAFCSYTEAVSVLFQLRVMQNTKASFLSQLTQKETPASLPTDLEEIFILQLVILLVLNEEEQNALAVMPAHPAGLYALYANCLAGNLVEQFWNFAWKVAIALIHPSLLPVAVISSFTEKRVPATRLILLHSCVTFEAQPIDALEFPVATLRVVLRIRLSCKTGLLNT